MKKNIFYCGIDVDDTAFNGYLISQKTGEFYSFRCKPNASSLLRKINEFSKQGFTLKVCYEACYLGFSLHRELMKNKIDCVVIASSAIPKSPGDRIKTDKKDSKNLAILYMKGMLTSVHVPEPDDEADRDLIRSRDFLKQQLNSLKCHILAVCRRMNIHFLIETTHKCHWTKTHKEWLCSAISKIKQESAKKNLHSLLLTMDQLEDSIKNYDVEIEHLSKHEKYKKRTQALTCYKGIKILTAMAIITELGDVRRFPHPKNLTSYLGLDIAEYSSGGRERKFGITKTGNSHVRRRLIEACQKCQIKTYPKKDIRERKNETPLEFIEIANRCRKRLYSKSIKLKFREKNANKIKVACARELGCFIWESLRLAA